MTANSSKCCLRTFLPAAQDLKELNWIDNRTRALLVEFSVYNAQSEYLTIAKIATEFVGGGVVTKYRFDPRILFPPVSGGINVVLIAQILFVVSVLYLVISSAMVAKKLGCRGFCGNFWHMADLSTIIISLAAIAMFVAKELAVMDVVRLVNETKGNSYLRLNFAMDLTEYYELLLSFTIFTSTAKATKLISFHKAFMQIAATIRKG